MEAILRIEKQKSTDYYQGGGGIHIFILYIIR